MIFSQQIKHFSNKFPATKNMLMGYIPPLRKLRKSGTGGTTSSRYCYSVWMRHIVMACKNGIPFNARSLVEIGPGDSLGIGLTGMLAGIDNYFAVDAVEHTNIERNAAIFDELVALFSTRSNIPDELEFPEVIPRLDVYEFPYNIFPDDIFNDLLSVSRVESIRSVLLNMNNLTGGGASIGYGVSISYKAPWYAHDIIEENSVDMIISQAVLEHVNDLGFLYGAMSRWLKRGGLMSHTIDFRSHGFAKKWNGHWAYSDRIWKMITRGRPYSINRAPHSVHLELLKQHGFDIICDIKFKDFSGINRKDLYSRFADLSDEDMTTSRAFIQAVKR